MAGLLRADAPGAMELRTPLAERLIVDRPANNTGFQMHEQPWWSSLMRYAGDSMEEVCLVTLILVLCLWLLAVTWAACGKGAETMYEPIRVRELGHRLSDSHLCLNYLFYVPLHLLRSMQNTAANKKFASSSERQYLHEQRHVFNDKVIEFLVIRRSMIFCAAVFSILTCGTAVRELMRALVAREDWIEMAVVEGETGQVLNFEEYMLRSDKPWADNKDPELWAGYLTMMSRGMLAKLMKQTSARDVLGSITQVVCTLISSVFLWQTTRVWSQFWISRNLIRMSWLFTVIAPFLITMVPVRPFIDWTVLDPVQETVTAEMTHQLGEEAWQKAAEVVENCQKLIKAHDGGAGQKMTGTMERLCGFVAKLPNRHVQCCPMYEVINKDFRPLHKACGRVDFYLDHPDGPAHESALNTSAHLCREYIIPYGETQIQYGFDNTLQQLAILAPLAAKSRTGLEIAFALGIGLKGLKHILPAALALAPALLRGALKVKVVAPQSTIPGMFVLILPWLFCPLSWAIYHIFYQLLGDLYMLGGLLILAFAPMSYYFLGKHYNITRPLTDEKVDGLMQSLGRVSMIVAIVGYIFIGVFVAHQVRLALNREENTLEDDLGELIVKRLELISWYNMIEMVGNAFAKYTLTTLTGVDWMMQEIGQQRRYETLLVIAEKLAELDEEECENSNYPQELRTSSARQELQEVAKERQGRLDCVEWILYNEVPLRIEEQELELQIRKSVCSERSSVGSESAGTRRRKHLVPVVKVPSTEGIELSSASDSSWKGWSRQGGAEGEAGAGRGGMRSNLLRMQEWMIVQQTLQEQEPPRDDAISGFLGRRPAARSSGASAAAPVASGGDEAAGSAVQPDVEDPGERPAGHPRPPTGVP